MSPAWSPARAMERAVTMWLRRPRAASQSVSARPRGCDTVEKAASPPSTARPSRPRPSDRLPATEPTPAMAATPSAMQIRKIQ